MLSVALTEACFVSGVIMTLILSIAPREEMDNQIKTALVLGVMIVSAIIIAMSFLSLPK
jgi:hypothetical protein